MTATPIWLTFALLGGGALAVITFIVAVVVIAVASRKDER